MKPERYLLDMDPAASRGLTHGEVSAITCKYCSGTIEIKLNAPMIVSACDLCQAGFDKALEQKMMAHGHAGGWPLYWNGRVRFGVPHTPEARGRITTFYSKVGWAVSYVAVGYHNIARYQYRLNWRMPDGMVWCSTVYGHNTQLVSGARRLKRQP